MTILHLIGDTDTATAGAGLICLLIRGGIALDLTALLRDDLHILLPRILHHREVLLREDLGHIHVHHHSDHEGDGEDHGYVEEVDDDGQWVGIFALHELARAAWLASHSYFVRLSRRSEEM